MSVGAQCHHPNVMLLDAAPTTAGPPKDQRYLWCRDCGLLLSAFPTDKERRREEAAHTATIIQRDMLHDIADELAERISKITGVEIGEHSSNNDPWMNAKYAADEYLAKPQVDHFGRTPEMIRFQSDLDAGDDE